MPTAPPPDSKPTPSLAELAIDVARDCLDRLTGPEALSDEETVHALRVATKRLRAIWRLVKDLVSKDKARERGEALRDLSGHLSAARDNAVLAQLVQNLAASQSDGRIAIALDHVGESLRHQADNHVPEISDPGGALALIRERLTDEIAAWHFFDHCDPAAIRRAVRHQLRRSRRRARRDAHQVKKSADPELWHEWRKAVKRLRYQREFVAASQARIPGKFDEKVSRLGTRLGERNDLANLAAYVDEIAANESSLLDKKSHGLIRKAIAAEEKHLMRNCRRLGRLAFL